MSRRPWIVVFEDNDDRRTEIADNIERELPANYRVFRFDPKTAKVPHAAHAHSAHPRPSNKAKASSKKKPSNGTAGADAPTAGAYEDRLVAMFSTPEFADIAIFATDRDLSRSTEFPGLSEAAVSKAAAMLGVPVCVYSAGKDDSVLERQRSGGDGRIILDSSDLAKMAHRICVLAIGFESLRSDLATAAKKKKANGPAMLLASALGQSSVAAHIALYVSGDQRMIAEMMPVSKSVKIDDALQQRVNTALGTWLYDSVLRFPGVLVDEVSAASFLNIQPSKFADDSVRRLFNAALYKGPFIDEAAPRWWRHLLGDLLNDAKVPDGRAFVKIHTKKVIAACTCSVDGKSPAGFVCAVTLKPVCKPHSVGQVGWLPRGADLTRVTRKVFDELSPWIGVS